MSNNYLESDKSYEIDSFKGEILRLMDHCINGVFAEIISQTSDFKQLKSVLSKLNDVNKINNFNVNGSTPEEVLNANSVDKRFNYIQYQKKQETYKILESWSVKVDITIEIVLLRGIRNRLSHYDDLNKYKNINDVIRDLYTIECFMIHFKHKFPNHYNYYIRKGEEIYQKANDFSEKYNENIEVSLKSNKVSIEEYCRELQNDIFYGLSMEAVKEKLYVALGNLGIDISDGKFKKDARVDIIKYFYKIKGFETQEVENEELETIKQIEVESLLYKNIDIPKIQAIIRDNNIFVDYRCLIHTESRTYLKEKIIPILKRSGDKAKLFYVFESLKNYFELHNNNCDNDAIIKFINSNMDVYSSMKTGKGTVDDNNHIMSLLNEKYYNTSFCVITDNQCLIRSIQETKREGVCIINIKSDNSDVSEKKEHKFNQEKHLSGQMDSKEDSIKGEKLNDSNQTPNLKQRHEIEAERFKPLFKLQKRCIDDSNILLNVSEIPDEGDEVYTVKQGKAIKLLKFINGGGEGNIYSTSESGIVVKIYIKKCITKNRKDKLTLMTSNQPYIKNVCWPIDTITNKSGEFVGYLMAQARGTEMSKTIFKGKCKGFNRTELVECVSNIFEVISKLHKNNILLGDINGGNILIQSPQEIYFVDTDSYQIENYPCPVGTELFTPPEIFKSESGVLRDFSKFLRSQQDERYALGVLAFMTLIPGATPYQMVEGRFQSGFRFPQTGKKAEGNLIYNYIWSYINFQVKQLFWMIFDENDREVTADIWIRTLNIYKRDIGDDETKNKIFITKYKDLSGDTFVSNKICPKCEKTLNITVEDYNRKSASGKEVWCRACTLKNIHMKKIITFMVCDRCRRQLCVSKADYDKKFERLINVRCDRCGRNRIVYANEYNRRVNSGWTILCDSCDDHKGLKNIDICCNECDSNNGIRVKYAVPSLTDILNEID